jgi:hypothetical protein
MISLLYLRRFNTIQDDIDLKHETGGDEPHNSFNTIQDDIDLKLSSTYQFRY